MPKATKKSRSKPKPKSVPASQPEALKGWQQIATFLGQPVAVGQRWASTSGMPVRREGRFVTATTEELNNWLGREAGGGPVHVATPEADLAAELKRGLAYVRGQKREPPKRTNK
jgi:hypothetical protein